MQLGLLPGAPVVRWRRCRLAFVVALLCCALDGCAPGYIIKLGLEEGRILWRRRPIEQVLASDTLSGEQRRKLSVVVAAREFAREQLGLNVGGNFTTVSYLTPGTEIYVLSAAPVDLLEPYLWWFPVVGRLPYKGFFDRASAEAAQAALRRRGFDTYLRVAAAFSTLGWFDDPILLSALDQDEVSLVNMVLHELSHNTFSLGGDTAFDESFANFVGTVGAAEFFTLRDGDGSTLARRAWDAWEDELRLAGFFRALGERLAALYASRLPEPDLLQARKEIFRSAAAEMRGLNLHQHVRLSSGWLNNAIVIHHLLYLTGMDIFAGWYASHRGSLREAIAAITVAVRGHDRPFEVLQAAPERASDAVP